MSTKKKSRALKEIYSFLKSDTSDNKKTKYSIPSIWLNPNSKKHEDILVNPFQFYKKKIEDVLEYDFSSKNKKSDLSGEWSKDSIVFNIFVRLTSAYDHNRNGKIDLPINDDGWRETGTFLKTIALLPYLKKMGINTIHLLPITSIGHDGNKGRLGSPYAIKNPYKIDENLAEPILGFDVDFQFKALVEAVKRMGFRIVLEFVFRTAAKDSDWIEKHPDWFYWILDDIEIREPGENSEKKYGSPVFSPEELQSIHQMVNEKRYDNLLKPHKVYQDMFTEIPKQIEYDNNRYLGITNNNLKVKIPGAFADWPPDDNQPPWSDVTYLRMYKHQSYNYIAYNTIRMYDSNLAQYENRNKSLWEKIIDIIPHYQNEFNIDGVMIDMGHALPPELLKAIVKKARLINPYFAFWEENFSITEKSVEQGYNITLGYLWSDEHHSEKLKNILRTCSSEKFPLPFFATSETHNTPRSVCRKEGIVYSKYSFMINCFLPAIVFIHSGYELGEELPVNTGLDFLTDDLKKYPSEDLPLFSEGVYDWNSKVRFIELISKVLKIRERYSEVITNRSPETFSYIECSDSDSVCFYRISKDKSKVLYVLANSNFYRNISIEIDLIKIKGNLFDRFANKKVIVKDGKYSTILLPGEVKIIGN